MSGYSTSNPKELKDAILRRLGAPVVNVEVTEQQIFDCISRSIELFTEYHPDGLNRTFITVQLDAEQARTGFVKFDKPIYAVSKILRAASSFWTMDGNATHTWFSDFLQGLAGGASAGGCSTYHGGMLGQGDLTTYSMLMSYKNTMMDQLQPVDDFWYNSMNNTIRMIGNHAEGDLMVFECWAQTAMLVQESGTGIVGNENNTVGYSEQPKPVDYWDNPYSALNQNNVVGNPNLYAEQGVYNVRWVKDYSTALTKELQGTILKKHQGMQLPGGVTIDGQSIYNEAVTEIEKLRQELMDISEPLPIIWG